MQDQDFGSHSSKSTTSSGRDSKPGGVAGTASDALSKTRELSGQAAEAARRTAADTASNVTSHVRELLDRQVGAGASLIGHVADSARRVANDLDRDAPQLAGLMRGVADQVSHYADDMHDQTVEDLVRTASDFTRRQPALVFGLAALAGFFAFRTLKHSPSMISSPPIQPSQEGFGGPSYVRRGGSPQDFMEQDMESGRQDRTMGNRHGI